MAEKSKSTAAFQVLDRFAKGDLSAEATIRQLRPILADDGESVNERLARAGQQREARRRNQRGER